MYILDKIIDFVIITSAVAIGFIIASIAIILIIIFFVTQLIRRTVLNAAQNIQNLTQSIIEELQKTKEEINP
ncbi:MAG: hypothetical protein PWP19_1826 [Thermococcaceae archaeon]|nr:hypothetical protein [Thermococcaceae archaeon]